MFVKQCNPTSPRSSSRRNTWALVGPSMFCLRWQRFAVWLTTIVLPSAVRIEIVICMYELWNSSFLSLYVLTATCIPMTGHSMEVSLSKPNEHATRQEQLKAWEEIWCQSLVPFSEKRSFSRKPTGIETIPAEGNFPTDFPYKWPHQKARIPTKRILNQEPKAYGSSAVSSNICSWLGLGTPDRECNERKSIVQVQNHREANLIRTIISNCPVIYRWYQQIAATHQCSLNCLQ